MSSESPSCPFCAIAGTYPPISPTSTPHTSASYDPTLVTPSTFLLLSTPLCLAFLDIMPLSPGHLLVTTRKHAERLSDVSEAEARELGHWLRVLSRVLARGTDTWDWNVVQNNGAAAAQVVPHVHYHIIPRPKLSAEARNRSFTMFGRGQRSELDDDEAEELVKRLRVELKNEVERAEGGKL